jgi:uncharacterized membrane protein YidH (DUF202 family)
MNHNFYDFGKLFITIGVFLILVGILISFVGKIPYLGRLPGDIYIKKERFIFYFPLATSIIISIILTIILNVFFRK